jgi:hypothetical protein
MGTKRLSMTTPRTKLKNQQQSMVKMTKIRDDIFVFLDDMKIPKRGEDGTPQADSWVVLEPGFSVVDSADLTKLDDRFHETGSHGTCG